MEDKTPMDNEAIITLKKHITLENSHAAKGVRGAIVDLLASRLPNQPRQQEESNIDISSFL
jgi:hypothetical protein